MTDADELDQIDADRKRSARTTLDLVRGVEAIRTQVRTLGGSPGVYRMLNADGEILYVGKARNLKRRVASYAQPGRMSVRMQRMVAETESIEVLSTHTEVEALLLEANMIKRHRPRYNILLRDDKSFPYIHVTGDHEWPQITKYRGARGDPGRYFGPFASAGAVNRTVNALERAFLLRTCSNTVFAGRTRPCLKYQLKRCSAPCVGRIGRDEYNQLVEEACDFLAGRSRDVQERLVEAMQRASADLEFELAARYRDRIRAMAQVQAHQDINIETGALGECDVAAAHMDAGQACIQVFFFRAGRNNGNRAYFPKHDRSVEIERILGAFLGQFYDNKSPPRLILLSHDIPEQALLEEALGVSAGRKISLVSPRRGMKRKVVEHALRNAREALARRLAESASQRRLLERLAEVFGLEGAPERIEVYDNSHISGANASGAMIVAGPEGLRRNAYRKFTIKRPSAPGDDYAMMREVLSRRFARALKEDPARERGQWPDLVLVDGGAGQLTAAREALTELGIEDVPIVAVAKGPDRDAGRERFHAPDRAPFRLDEKDPLLYFLQRLRDEAHRFAVGTHRARRSKEIGRSPLDEIAGVGARRKRALLNHFGSARHVARAGLEDLAAVDGVSRALAKKVYDFFHEEE
ncbi:MAG: excinuclease ABC subunit UvrC [Alphaproteobacteria bacterium]